MNRRRFDRFSWRDQALNDEFAPITHQTRTELHDTFAVGTGGRLEALA